MIPTDSINERLEFNQENNFPSNLDQENNGKNGDELESINDNIREKLEIRVKEKIPRKPAMQPNEKAQLYELRNSFRISLTKLTKNDTREIALKELKNLISSNVTQPALRIFLSSLVEANKPINVSGKEAQVQLLGELAEKFQENLIDPLDKPPTIIKTVIRVSEAIRQYLKVII